MRHSPGRGPGSLRGQTGVRGGLLFVLQLDAVLGAVLDIFGVEFTTNRTELCPMGRQGRGLLLCRLLVLFHGVADQSPAEGSEAGTDRSPSTRVVSLVPDDCSGPRPE